MKTKSVQTATNGKDKPGNKWLREFCISAERIERWRATFQLDKDAKNEERTSIVDDAYLHMIEQGKYFVDNDGNELPENEEKMILDQRFRTAINNLKRSENALTPPVEPTPSQVPIAEIGPHHTKEELALFAEKWKFVRELQEKRTEYVVKRQLKLQDDIEHGVRKVMKEEQSKYAKDLEEYDAKQLQLRDSQFRNLDYSYALKEQQGPPQMYEED